ncbi:hypothetical protein B0T21DRAFT_350671 [Apiosordaria backusii]|uniref:Carbohydrate-binding module family 18 protein n=1 Tax=Apiosordaria backusii TaxID=314023 RepID=A0AA40B2T1_9PEZI|nr:hypothetical protein B0T21DRAFT_350671 [Apiosordaria backusii]
MKLGFSMVVGRNMLSAAIFRGLVVSALAVTGISAECTRFIEAYEGDTCAILAEIAGITVTQFLRSNPSVTSCSQLVPGGYYCIEGVADSGPTASATLTKSAAPTSSSPVRLSISQDGSCGSGVTCTGSSFGNCCSPHGFCGSSADYCLADGCQRAFGSCGAGAVSSAPITPGPTASVTVTVTSVVAVTRTSILSQTSTATVTTTIPQTVLTTRTITNTVPATAFTTQTVRVTSTTTLTTGATTTLTRTVDLTLTSIVTRTATIPVTATLTTVITNLVEVTTTTTRSSTTTTTRTVQTVVPVTQTLTTILTSVSTRVLTSTAIVTSGTCGTPTTRAPATTTTPSGSRPTLPGTPSNCKNLAIISKGDTCRSLSQKANLTLIQFYDLNPSVSRDPLLGEDDLDRFCTPDFIDLLLSGLCQINCDQLWEGYYVQYRVPLSNRPVPPPGFHAYVSGDELVDYVIRCENHDTSLELRVGVHVRADRGGGEEIVVGSVKFAEEREDVGGRLEGNGEKSMAARAGLGLGEEEGRVLSLVVEHRADDGEDEKGSSFETEDSPLWWLFRGGVTTTARLEIVDLGVDRILGNLPASLNYLGSIVGDHLGKVMLSGYRLGPCTGKNGGKKEEGNRNMADTPFKDNQAERGPHRASLM